MIDFIVSNSYDFISSHSKSQCPFINGYDRLDINMNVSTHTNKANKYSTRKFGTHNLKLFNNSLKAFLSNSTNILLTPTTLGHNISHCTTNALDTHVPLITRPITHSRYPWVTSEAKSLK